MGENILEKYLEELVIMFDQDILHALGKEAFKSRKIEFDDEGSAYKPSKSIKYILAVQKQYISLLNSYSNIIGNLKSTSELIVNVNILFFILKLFLFLALLQSSFNWICYST